MSAYSRIRRLIGMPRRRDTLPDHVTVGRRTYGVHRNMFVRPSAAAPVSIGSFCSIGPDVLIFGQADHPTDRTSTYPFRSEYFLSDRPPAEPVTRGPVAIGHDVWIAARAVILSGVTIGHGAVIGAGSVVARNVPPYAIVAGNPAEIIRYRFEPEIIEALLKIAWWDWPEDKIAAHEETLYGDVRAFIAAAGGE